MQTHGQQRSGLPGAMQFLTKLQGPEPCCSNTRLTLWLCAPGVLESPRGICTWVEKTIRPGASCITFNVQLPWATTAPVLASRAVVSSAAMGELPVQRSLPS